MVEEPDDRAVHIRINPAGLTRLLAAIAAVLIVLGAATIILRFGFGHDHVYGLLPRFDLDRELSVPTWYSMALLLVAALLLGAVAVGRRAARDPFARHWAGLVIIFLLLSLDEGASLHGLPSQPLRAALDLPGFLYYAWVIPMSLAVVVFGLFYARFTGQLPARTRALFVTAGAVFVGGALGGEVVAGAYRSAFGIDGGYATLALVEESLEMGGCILFIFAVADYLARHHGTVRVAIGDGAPSPVDRHVPTG